MTLQMTPKQMFEMIDAVEKSIQTCKRPLGSLQKAIEDQILYLHQYVAENGGADNLLTHRRIEGAKKLFERLDDYKSLYLPEAHADPELLKSSPATSHDMTDDAPRISATGEPTVATRSKKKVDFAQFSTSKEIEESETEEALQEELPRIASEIKISTDALHDLKKTHMTNYVLLEKAHKRLKAAESTYNILLQKAYARLDAAESTYNMAADSGALPSDDIEKISKVEREYAETEYAKAEREYAEAEREYAEREYAKAEREYAEADREYTKKHTEYIEEEKAFNTLNTTLQNLEKQFTRLSSPDYRKLYVITKEDGSTCTGELENSTQRRSYMNLIRNDLTPTTFEDYLDKTAVTMRDQAISGRKKILDEAKLANWNPINNLKPEHAERANNKAIELHNSLQLEDSITTHAAKSRRTDEAGSKIADTADTESPAVVATSDPLPRLEDVHFSRGTHAARQYRRPKTTGGPSKSNLESR